MNKTLVYLLCVLVFFEDLICVFLPTNISIIFHNLSDVLALASVPVVLFYFFYNKKTSVSVIFKENRLIYLLLIVPLGCLMLQYFRTSCINIGNYWTLIRFVLVYFLVRTCDSEAVFRFFIRAFNVCFFVQVAIGFLQILKPDVFLELFMPSYTRVDLDEGMFFTGGREGEMSGYFAHTIHYAYLMLMKLLFIKHKQHRNWFDYLVIAIIPVMIFNTDVIFSLLLCFLFMAEIFFGKIDFRKILLAGGIAMALLLTVKIVYEVQVTPGVDDYVEKQMATRLGIIVYTYAPLMYTSGAILGVSNCSDYLDNWTTMQLRDAPQPLVNLFLIIYEDVFYGAFILYFGYISLAILLLYLWSVLQRYKQFAIKINGINLDGFVRDMIFMFLLLNFVNQASKVKVFSFVFWFVIAVGSAFTVVKSEK